MDVGRVLDGGILLARIPKGSLGEEATRIVGSIIVAHTWTAATARARIPQQARRDAALVIDECHNFLNLPYSIDDLLAEARGLRLSLTLAHQNLAQLPPELRAGITANARNKLIFTVGADDARDLARHTQPHLDDYDLAHLDAFHAAARLLDHAALTPAFTLRTRPLPPPHPPALTTTRRTPAAAPAATCEEIRNPDDHTTTTNSPRSGTNRSTGGAAPPARPPRPADPAPPLGPVLRPPPRRPRHPAHRPGPVADRDAARTPRPDHPRHRPHGLHLRPPRPPPAAATPLAGTCWNASRPACPSAPHPCTTSSARPGPPCSPPTTAYRSPRCGYRRDDALAIAHHHTLAHTVAVNDLFAHLVHHTLHPRARMRLDCWWSEARCRRVLDYVRPDAYARLTTPTRTHPRPDTGADTDPRWCSSGSSSSTSAPPPSTPWPPSSTATPASPPPPDPAPC